MRRDQLSDMTVFVEVARCYGFRAAARRLGLGPGSVSQAVQRFEDRLGVRLLERTTRRIALTDAGRTLYRRCLPAITDIEGAMRDLSGPGDGIGGVLRLSAPESAGPLFLDDLVARYLAVYPDVQIDLTYDDRKVDLVTSGLDAAIRSNALLEQDTHALPVGPSLAMAVVASPAFLDRHGVPATPADLTGYDGICFRMVGSGSLAPWSFEGAQGSYSVSPKPRVVINDLRTMLRLAVAGLGNSYLYAAAAAPLIADGELVSVLEGLASTRPKYAVNYVSKRHMPARLRAFLELAKGEAESPAFSLG